MQSNSVSYRPLLSKLVVLLLLAALAWLVTGCERKPADLLQKVQQYENEARIACEKKDAAAATKAAAQAQSTAAKLRNQVQPTKPLTPDLQAMVQKAEASAAAAREHACVAREEQQVCEKLATLKLRSYRRMRGTVCQYGFASLIPAVDKAAASRMTSLSGVDRELADTAWQFVHWVGERPALTNGSPDWSGAASDLRVWSTNPPPRMGQYLGLGFVLCGFNDLALCELECVDASSLATSNSRAFYHGGRSLVYALQNCNTLARRELDQAMRLCPEGWKGLTSTQAVALIHVWYACNSLKSGKWGEADTHITRSMQLWPDNPIAVFLTGERLAATGQWEKAAASLEARVAGTKDEWMAKRLARRARELRDGKGKASALFTEPGLLVELTGHVILNAIQDSEAAGYFQRLLEQSRAMAQTVGEKLALTPAKAAKE